MLKRQFLPGVIEAGCDEAGRGSLAGPVFAAAVILPEAFSLPGLNDSKLLTENNRNLFRKIIENEALAWSVGMADEGEIDQINIRNASFLAMHRALKELPISPAHILVDGNHFPPYGDIPHRCIVKGDRLYMSIAAASVLAKTHRDDFMNLLDQKLPYYRWSKNKGYATKGHVEAIKEHGFSKYHRKSFHIQSLQLQINFPNRSENKA
jgi:ribonuclease HII